jgi:hypothetical protein
MGRWMMLGEAVGLISFSWFPEMALINPVADPVETHVHGVGSALIDSFVGYACAAIVVRGW